MWQPYTTAVVTNQKPNLLFSNFSHLILQSLISCYHQPTTYSVCKWWNNKSILPVHFSLNVWGLNPASINKASIKKMSSYDRSDTSLTGHADSALALVSSSVQVKIQCTIVSSMSTIHKIFRGRHWFPNSTSHAHVHTFRISVDRIAEHCKRMARAENPEMP